MMIRIWLSVRASGMGAASLFAVRRRRRISRRARLGPARKRDRRALPSPIVEFDELAKAE
jgi:hypothetical protein